MFLRKYRLHIIIAFLGIFSVKMMISGAPVFFNHIDKEIMNSVIMQIEVEHSADGETGKVKVKLCDFRIDMHYDYSFLAILSHYGIKSSFLDHFRRHVDPFHPSVPTPPPNVC